MEATRLYRNRGDGTFEDVTRAAGLEDKVIFAMGHNFGDLDNDGWLDFQLGTGNPDLRSVIPNRMFLGVDGVRFREVTIEGAQRSSRALARASCSRAPSGGGRRSSRTAPIL